MKAPRWTFGISSELVLQTQADGTLTKIRITVGFRRHTKRATAIAYYEGVADYVLVRGVLENVGIPAPRSDEQIVQTGEPGKRAAVDW